MGVLTNTTAEVQSAISEQYEDLQKTNVVWEDLRGPFTQAKQGATTKPDFDYTNIGLLFPQNDPDEIAYIIMQLPHARKADSAIRPHIHFVQAGATPPVFKIDYRWYNNGEDPTVAFTTLTCDSYVFTYTSGSILQICSFPEIAGTNKGTSSILEVKVYRDDNVVTGDVLAKEFDVHYQIDQMGSRQEFIK